MATIDRTCSINKRVISFHNQFLFEQQTKRERKRKVDTHKVDQQKTNLCTHKEIIATYDKIDTSFVQFTSNKTKDTDTVLHILLANN